MKAAPFGQKAEKRKEEEMEHGKREVLRGPSKTLNWEERRKKAMVADKRAIQGTPRT